ncbi:hypothetical protein EAY39_08045 [Vibrio anguillarum]|nr:hypothetical protein CMV05_23185 [Vibrio anguillarum]MBF4249487.1 hypothetical protein [Vibrio anguillarum]MBF4340739.1 hypothetical protein [Vibrio anguillarum]
MCLYLCFILWYHNSVYCYWLNPIVITILLKNGVSSN